MSDDCAATDGFIVAIHPDADTILARYPVGTVVEVTGGDLFIVGHRAEMGMVLAPITAEEAERICSYVEPISNASRIN